MAEFKKLSAVEAVEAVSETANVLIEENGVIKRAAKSEIGAQADWAEMDENSPAFIKNKPECVLDIDITCSYDPDADDMIISYNINKIDSYENIKNRIFNGELQECKSKLHYQTWGNADSGYMTEVTAFNFIVYNPQTLETPEHIMFSIYGENFGFFIPLTADDVIQGVFPD